MSRKMFGLALLAFGIVVACQQPSTTETELTEHKAFFVPEGMAYKAKVRVLDEAGAYDTIGYLSPPNSIGYLLRNGNYVEKRSRDGFIIGDTIESQPSVILIDTLKTK
jgi:hypothetical protein